jgi:hypothetical protein
MRLESIGTYYLQGCKRCCDLESDANVVLPDNVTRRKRTYLDRDINEEND